MEKEIIGEVKNEEMGGFRTGFWSIVNREIGSTGEVERSEIRQPAEVPGQLLREWPRDSSVPIRAG